MGAVNHHLSLGLTTIVNKMVGKGHTVLDLGPLSTLIAPLFLQKQCKCYIEDMHEYVHSLNLDSSNPFVKLEQFLLEKPKGITFDFILCWDLFNFLSLEIISHLMALLKPYLKPGTILHTMRYTGATTPPLPRVYKRTEHLTFQVNDTLSNQKTIAQLTPQAHTTIMLLRSMPDFSLYDASLNKEGMLKDVTEYLLEYGTRKTGQYVKKRLNSQDVVSYFSQQKNTHQVSFVGLTKLLSDTRHSQGLSVFEAGAKTGRDTASLNHLCQNLYVEDIYSSILWQNKLAANNEGAITQHIIGSPKSMKFNLVLMWDIFNFCSHLQIHKIGKLLASNLSQAAKIHIIIYKGQSIPAKPGRYEVHDANTVNINGEIKRDTPKTLKSVTELTKLLPDFKLYFHHFGGPSTNHSFQEFILEYKG